MNRPSYNLRAVAFGIEPTMGANEVTDERRTAVLESHAHFLASTEQLHPGIAKEKVELDLLESIAETLARLHVGLN